nr:glyoxylate/hydroxypyruvate reductase A [Pseudopedobacter sp.]
MSIAIIFTNKNPDPWQAALKIHLPETVVEVYPSIKDYAAVDFILCWKPEPNVIDKFPNLKVIQSIGAGIDRIINTQTIKEDQKVTRMVDENLSNDMFEFLLVAVLGQLKNINLYQQQQAQKMWLPTNYNSIKDFNVCILGLGTIGSFVAGKFVALGFKVKGWSVTRKDILGVESFEGEQEMSAALNGTDILINILPATRQTENILNKNRLKQLNKDAFLINVGRGEHLIEEDLLSLLDEGHLSGALLDVFKVEPLPINHPFWVHPKIQVTPHVASITNIKSAVLTVATNYQNHLSGKPLKFEVSLKKGY